LVYEGLQVVRDASVESVPLARLQSDVYGKQAAKMSRVEWGDREERGMSAGGGGITIVIGSVVPPQALPMVIEGERVGDNATV
jgi:hypothetical protein